MQLSKETVEVLKNFSMINQSIIIREGNNLITHSTDRGGMIATATINEHFPRQFALYELNKFINSLSLVEDYELDFKDTHVLIKNRSKRLKYTYSDPDFVQFNVEVPVPKLTYVENFNITARDLATLRKSAGALNLDTIRITAVNKRLFIRSGSKDSKDEFSIDTRETTENDFMMVYPVQRLAAVMALDYEVSVNNIGFARFRNDRITYWIAPNNETDRGSLK